MAIGIHFQAQNFDPRAYAAINERLGEMDTPPGRPFHAAYRVGDTLHVFDVWESQEAFEAFGQHLMPLLEEFGVDPGQPTMGEIERILTQDTTDAD
jgi:hypothetical protein